MRNAIDDEETTDDMHGSALVDAVFTCHLYQGPIEDIWRFR